MFTRSCRKAAAGLAALGLAALAAPQAPAGSYEQDFGAFNVGDTSFGDGSELRSDHLGSVASVQEPNQKELQLTADGVNSVWSVFVLPDLDPGRAVSAFSIKWTTPVYSESWNRADGFSLSFGQIPGGLWGETGYGGGLCLSVRTYNGDGARGFRILNNNVEKSYVWYDGWGSLDWTRHYFELDFKSDGKVNFWMDGTQYATNVASGYTPQAGDRFAFGARTGGADEEVRLDNIVAYTGGTLAEDYWLDATGLGTNTAGEEPDKAFDRNSGTKWLAWGQSAPYLQARSADGKPKRMLAYTITTANDVDTRDPKTWRVLGSSDGQNWTTVDTENYGAWMGLRYSRRAFLVNNPGSYKWYRLQIDSNFGAGDTQLADFRPLMDSTAVGVLSSQVRSTIRDFDRTGLMQTPYTVRVDGGGYTPAIVSGGALGNVLQLTDGGAGEVTSAAFDQTCAITDPIYTRTPAIVIDFDLRAQPVTGQADGTGVVLLRAADYGSTGVGPWWLGDEPNVTSTHGPNFGVGFDIYGGGEPDNNHVSLHFGSLLTQNPVPFDFSTTRFHHAQVRVAFREARSGADVTVTMQENSLGMDGVASGSPQTVINNYFVPGFTPYDFRVQFAARTGGETAIQQLDNLYVLCGATGWAWGGDMRGATASFTVRNNALFRTDGGGGAWQEWLNLTQNGMGQTGAGWLNAKQPVKYGFTADFQWRINFLGAPGADGLCFSVQNSGTSELPAEWGMPAKALSIGFDTYQNDGEPSDTVLRVLDGSTALKTVNLKTVGFDFNYDPQYSPYLGRYDVHVDYFPRHLSVYVNDTLVVDDLNVDLTTLANGSAVDADGKAYLGFGARTGGATENHDILNLHFANVARADAGSLFLIR